MDNWTKPRGRIYGVWCKRKLHASTQAKYHSKGIFVSYIVTTKHYIDGLVQDYSNSSVLAVLH